MIRTSITHPLQIQIVTAPGAPGLIGMTLCPGRKGSSASCGAWDRDLATDLEAVRAWEPQVIVALLEEHEFAGLGIPEFRRRVAAAGLPWAFAPIPDGGVPDEAFLRTWDILGPRVRNVLRRGGRVLIHCRAGLGRTGLLAASLLVELGMAPQAAIDGVRAARRDTIETPAQETYVRARRCFSARISRDARIAGSLFGAAAGDALGAAFEFVDAARIEAALGEPFLWAYRPALPGSLLAPREAGRPTDDTALALSVAHVVAAPDDLSADRFGTAFLQDLDRTTGRFAKMFWDGGPGLSTTSALARLQRGDDPATCGRPTDGGNGAAMRAHPIGTLTDREEVLRVAAVQARVTHGHPSAVAAAQAVAVIVHDALAGLEPVLEPPSGVNDPTFLNAWREAHDGIERGAARLPRHLTSADMSGWVTVATAHAISYVYQDEPKRAIAAAAASGRDTDTVATIVGAIVGARCGVDALNPEWRIGLQDRELVEHAIDLLVRHPP